MRTLAGFPAFHSFVVLMRRPISFAELEKTVSVGDPGKMLKSWIDWAWRGRATQPILIQGYDYAIPGGSRRPAKPNP
ncbi:hypothetical protein [Methylorubrum podarium]|jgi:hypothetical protein|uniref:hypothetical protein n=1 Tax=Methylorubrum podarium TaxID=200476 RepID=UPI001EE1804D|nr:hypothetical protein [Methylorubrum podarium]